MENKIVFKDKELKDCDNKVLGVSGENKQQILVFKIEEGFIDGKASLDLILPNDSCCDRKKYNIKLKKDTENECYKLEVKRSLLRYDGDVKMQLKIISNGVEIYKTAIFEMHVMEAINAVESIEDDYPDLVTELEIRMNDLEDGMEQVAESLKETKQEIEQVKKDAEGSIKEETDPTVPSHVKQITEENIKKWNGKSDFSGDYEDLANKPEPIDTSNFITKTVDDLVNYWKKTDTYNKEEINSMIGNTSTINIEVVESLPNENVSTSTIYLLAKENAEENNIYDEYIYVANKWEKIGDTKIDLSGYATIEMLNQAIANFLTSEQVNTLITNALANYYTQEEMNVLLGEKASTSYVEQKAGRMKIESMTESEATILPNRYYKWGEMAELTITLGEEKADGYTNEYCFEFKSGETATTLTIDESIKWVSEPSIEANRTYQVSILNGIGVIAGA